MRGTRHRRLRRAAEVVAGGMGAAALGYAALAAGSWVRYGRNGARPAREGVDLLDEFMPVWEVAERHAVQVAAPAHATFAAARGLDINRSRLVRALFAARSLPARLQGEIEPREPQSLVDETLAIGWRILAEVPGRLLIMGAATRAWEKRVAFRGIAPRAFAAFDKPGYVKIVWTLEAEPLGRDRSRFITRTRVVATDEAARKQFRRYWSLVSPGVRLIRRATLGLVKRDAERRWRK